MATLVTVEKTIYKAIAAVVAFAGIVVSNQLLHGTALEYTNEGIAFGSAFLVWLLPYTTKVSTTSTPVSVPVEPIVVVPNQTAVKTAPVPPVLP